MPKRIDIEKILVLGAGPIVIGQAGEFDYSGTQACKALLEEGYYVILVNSNPATIMTDPEIANVTYIEPIDCQTIEQIIAKERPHALLPTMGGQTALNCALNLAKQGVLKDYHVELIGANQTAIDKAEDRQKFRHAMEKIGLKVPLSGIAHSLEEAYEVLEQVGFPAIIRPSFTLGGMGGGIAYNRVEFTDICKAGLEISPTKELLIDESIMGWKEYEMEVVRDQNDNCIIVCSIENIDPMGIHTGDSITVAPAQTLCDKEYQAMRNASIAVLREIGVNTGGSNVQFAIDPANGDMRVIEMNPRVSRSSALASKATGFPIAKVAAKLSVGYTLDELTNEITQGLTPIAFEPAIDYVVVKIPRFNFTKFPQANKQLTTQMKSVGEVMAMGGNFKEALQKAICSLEVKATGFDSKFTANEKSEKAISRALTQPGWSRIWYVADALRLGFSVETLYKLTHIDLWFLREIESLIHMEKALSHETLEGLGSVKMERYKQQGFTDAYLAKCLGLDEETVRKQRYAWGIHPVFKRIDSCAGEFPTETAYLYSTYLKYCEANPSKKPKIIVIGGGPNRIGQGVEFDYCCVHAALAARGAGYETIMINCNPETVSTDYDISDRLYFEPLTLENLLEIVRIEKPKGVIVHYGGQTPLGLARSLETAGVPLIGTTPDAIDCAEDRERFQKLVAKLGLLQPANGTVRSIEEGLRLANVLAYPLVARPSYVLGGEAMEVIYNEEDFVSYMKRAVLISEDNPLLLDQFLDSATEVDVDAICDGKQVLIGGILEHIEQAGVHSGDSACCLPPHCLSEAIQQELIEQTGKIALALGVVGLLNIQFAIKENKIYLLEVNPRASRTAPFICKATGVPLIKIATLCMLGFSLKSQGYKEDRLPKMPYYAVKQPVFPFNRFAGVDPILGPEMRSTGETMGLAENFGQAFEKSMRGAGQLLPRKGRVFISVRDIDKPEAVKLAKSFVALGFHILATSGTAKALSLDAIPHQCVNKVAEGRPHIVDMIQNDEVQLIINTTEGKEAIEDSLMIRCMAIRHKVCITTTLAGGEAMVMALKSSGNSAINSLKALHQLIII